MDSNQLKEVLDKHSLWVKGDPNGQRANLTGADLNGADLTGANLSRAYLSRANLTGANLTGANLTDTCLDPNKEIVTIADSYFTKKGFEVDSDFVYGYRTKRSRHCGNTTYEVGQEYTAPYFSVSSDTDCHPGLYFATLDWLQLNYGSTDLVKVKARKDEVIKAGNKWRAKRLWVIEDYKKEQ